MTRLPVNTPPAGPQAELSQAAKNIIRTSVDDARSSLIHCSRETLLEAHRWCCAQPEGHRTRRTMIEREMRRRAAEEARRSARRTIRKGGRK
jgi:hypothetical protein